MKALQKENIIIFLRQNDQGIVYGITYIDHKTKCVFNGSHLGKQYSANAIQQRCFSTLNVIHAEKVYKQSLNHEIKTTSGIVNDIGKTFAELLQPERNQFAGEPLEQQKFKRKRKKKQQQKIT
jgi:hypothetical protein